MHMQNDFAIDWKGGLLFYWICLKLSTVSREIGGSASLGNDYTGKRGKNLMKSAHGSE